MSSNAGVTSNRLLRSKHSTLLCPKCGEFRTRLNEVTGWCARCTNGHNNANGSTNDTEEKERAICERCDRPTDDKFHKFCRTCRTARWLESIADEVERLMSEGLTKPEALVKAKHNARPNCKLCGDDMSPARLGERLFCMKPKCRSAFRRFNHLVHARGFSRESALKKVLEERRTGKK